MTVNLFRYHNLTERLTAFAVDGGAYLRGDREDVQVVDAEPLLRGDEREVARLGGLLQLLGPRTTSEDRATASLGLVLEAAGAAIVTTHRVILLANTGMSQLGRIGDDEVHTFAFPWDLVDLISMPATKSLTDRIAGARTIQLLSALAFMQLRLTPAKQVEIGGRVGRIDDDDAMRILTDAAVRHRMAVSPPDEHPRLQRLLNGAYSLSDGEKAAEITRNEDGNVPSHLVGRLAVGSAAKATAASLLLLETD